MEKIQELKDYSLGNFHTVIVTKDSLLSRLKENRDKHNAIYEAAVSGYWLEAQEVLVKKEVEFKEAKEKLDHNFKYQLNNIKTRVDKKDHENIGAFSLTLQYNNYWPLKYPENHLDDYERIINMLEMTIANKVELSMQDFDCYTRNNWSWKKDFVASNIGYVGKYTTSVPMGIGRLTLSGCAINITGSYLDTFASGCKSSF